MRTNKHLYHFDVKCILCLTKFIAILCYVRQTYLYHGSSPAASAQVLEQFFKLAELIVFLAKICLFVCLSVNQSGTGTYHLVIVHAQPN